MSNYLALNNPLAQPLHFVGLELLFVTCLALTVRDVFAAWRNGDRFAAFQWLAAFSYGIFMELIAFNFLDNYTHARFTVQLYHGKLPLYVVCVYPTFLYTGLRIVQRWRLKAIPEALLAGFAICLIDIPFDIAGVDAGWWVWSDKDPNLAVRWLGVPITSYYWYLMFGAVFALLCRFARPRLERKSLLVLAAFAPLVGAGIIVFGTLSFLPFHGLHALGVRQDAIVAAHLAGCAGLALLTQSRALGPSLRSLVWVPLLIELFHFVLLLSLPEVPHLHLKLAIVVAVIAGLLRLVLPASPNAVAPVEEIS